MKKMLSLCLALMMILGLAGSAVAEDAPVTLVYAEVNPLDSIVGQTATFFAEKVKELSNGTVTIDIQASGVLGAEADVLDGMLGGDDSIDMARISAFALNSYGAKRSVLLTLPYTFVSREHFWNFAASDLADTFLNESQELGLPIRGIFYGEEGFRHFFTSTELKGMEDLAGLKIRVSNDPIMNGLVEGLGASPTVVAWGELYSGLANGVCDGAEQPIGNYKSNAFPEVAPNMILNGHTLGAVQVVITDAGWEKLSENQQKAIMEAGALAGKFNAELSQKTEDEVLKGMIADGVNIVRVEDKAPWVEAAKAVVESNVTDEMRPIYEEIVGMQ